MALDDKAKIEAAVAELVQITAVQREIKEKQNLTSDQCVKMVADFDKYTEKYDNIIAEQKSALAKAEQEAKEAKDRAINLEKEFALLKDSGVKNVMPEGEDKKLMNALLRGKEELDSYLSTENGQKAYDAYVKTVASVSIEGVDLPNMVNFRKAAENYMRHKAAETPSMRTDINLQGGVLLTPEQSMEIMRKAVEMSPIEQYAKVVTISGKSIQQPVHEQLPRAYFAGELESTTNVTPKYSMMEFAPVRQSIQIPTSMEMLTQSGYDIVGEINMNAAQAFAVGLGYNCVLGDGVKKPEGFMASANVTFVDTIGNDAMVADDVIGLSYALKPQYRPTYFMNRLTLKAVRLLKDVATGRYIWSPGGDMAQGNMPLINGLPYVDTFSDMSYGVTTDNAKVMLLADMKEFYQITKNNTIFVLRDDITGAKYAQVNFIFHRWITGNVRNPEAGVGLQIQ